VQQCINLSVVGWVGYVAQAQVSDASGIAVSGSITHKADENIRTLAVSSLDLQG
jgi:hypothetical protein